jgi:hypothetical protein
VGRERSFLHFGVRTDAHLSILAVGIKNRFLDRMIMNLGDNDLYGSLQGQHAKSNTRAEKTFAKSGFEKHHNGELTLPGVGLVLALRTA